VVGSIIPADAPYTYSVKGKLPVSEMGTTLIHEHVLVDFVGADNISPDRWKHDDVIRKVLPYLLEIKQQGIKNAGGMHAGIYWERCGFAEKVVRTVRPSYPYQHRLLWRFQQQIFTQMGI
jgi:hypothetical protein